MHPATESATATSFDETLFARIADDLGRQGWSVMADALPPDLGAAILAQLQTGMASNFTRAGIGRNLDHALDAQVRGDAIRWIDGETAAERQWLDWSERLRVVLNRRLFLGLFSFESHFAHYAPGAFYRTHVDAFKGRPHAGDTNRVLSLVAYFNEQWQTGAGGELVIYQPQSGQRLATVTPAFGTLVLFLSEEFPHEVKPAARDRYSIAGWFRVNNSRHGQVDPPR